MPRSPSPPDSSAAAADAAAGKTKSKKKLEEKRKRKKQKKKVKLLRNWDKYPVDSTDVTGILYRLIALDIPMPQEHKSNRWHKGRNTLICSLKSIQRWAKKALKHQIKQRDDDDYENEETAKDYLFDAARDISKYLRKMDDNLCLETFWLETNHPHIMQELENSQKLLHSYFRKQWSKKTRKFVFPKNIDEYDEVRDYDKIRDSLLESMRSREKSTKQTLKITDSSSPPPHPPPRPPLSSEQREEEEEDEEERGKGTGKMYMEDEILDIMGITVPEPLSTFELPPVQEGPIITVVDFSATSKFVPLPSIQCTGNRPAVS